MSGQIHDADSTALTGVNDQRSLGAYYDHLARWVGVAHVFGYGGGRSALSVHRRLTDPRASGRPTPTRLHDVLAAALPPLPCAPRLLDAGCGFGGTMLDFAGRLGATCVGVTLSAAQASVGARAAERAGLAGRVKFVIGSYDAPPSGPFDLIVAIESLAHSADPEISLAALARVAAPGGLLAIVDDMPEPAGEQSPDLDAFKRGWRCPVLWEGARYQRALSSLGATLLVDADLSNEFRARPLTRIRTLERVNRVCRAVVPVRGWQGIMDSYYGGLALERMFQFKMMRYRLLVARLSGS